MKKNAKLFIGLALLSLGLTACTDDYFDKEAYNAKVKEAFPVDNVDPTHTWATMGSVTMNVSVNGDYGKNYRVAVYQENPLYVSPVTLLVYANVKSGETTKLEFSYPLASTSLYVAAFDEMNRRVVKTVPVTNGETIDLNFFGGSGDAARSTMPNWFNPDYSGQTRVGATRADGNSVDFSGGPWNIGTDGSTSLTISDAAKALLKSGNYLGAVCERRTDQSWYSSWNIAYANGWGNVLSKGSENVPEGTIHIYELKLTDEDISKIEESNGLSIKGSNITITRAYISEYSQAGSGSQGGGGGQGGGNNQNNDPINHVNPSTVTNNNFTNNSYSQYIKDPVDEISTADWINPLWRSPKYVVDLNSGDFLTLTQAALGDNSFTNDGRDKKWWRSEGNITLNMNLNGDANKLNKAVIYVKSGTMTLDYNYNGVTFIVGNGATLVLNGERYFGEGSRVVVMQGGTITANSVVHFCGKSSSVGFYNAGTATFNNKVYVDNISAEYGALVYNASTGTMNIDELISDRKYLYNYGTMKINKDFTITANAHEYDKLKDYYFYNQGYIEIANANLAKAVNYGEIKGTSINITDNSFFNGGVVNLTTLKVKQLTNFGKLTVEERLDEVSNAEWYTVNACYMHITKTTANSNFRKLIMLRNSRLTVEGDMTVWDSDNSYWEDKSLIEVKGNLTVKTQYNSLYVPTQSGEFAVLKVGGDITMPKYDAFKKNESGTLYLDWAEMADKYDHAFIKEIGNYSSYAGAVDQMLNIMSSAQITEDQAPSNITIPEGDCTGDGYNTNPPPVTPPVEVPQGYRFCYEDNFPTPGDYDFNDCVITVTPERDGSTVTLTVSIDATGATKQIGAALRIVGVQGSDLQSGTSCNVDLNDGLPEALVRIYGRTMSDMSNIFVVTDKGKNANGNDINDLVLRLFDDVHYAISRSTDRKFYNTVSPSDPLAGADYVDNTKDSRTMVFTFELSSDEVAMKFMNYANYDVFIVENHNGKTYEVHTRPFKFDEVLGTYYGDGSKLRLYQDPELESVNYPWAVCVPHTSANPFLYPVEWNTISGSKISDNDQDVYGNSHPAAYQYFKGWAANQNNNTDWYKYPTTGRVFVKE